MEPHVTAGGDHIHRSCEDAPAPSAGLTEKHRPGAARENAGLPHAQSGRKDTRREVGSIFLPQVRHRYRYIYILVLVNIATQAFVSLVSPGQWIMLTRSSLLSVRPNHTAAGVFQLALLTESHR